MSQPPRKILLICLRRLGDVLLTTALIRSLRAAWPLARIDVLVPPTAAPVLEGNADIDAVLTLSEGARFGESLRLALRIFRRYDLAISTLQSDRAHGFAFLAAPWRAGVVPPVNESGARWKRWSCRHWIEQRLHSTHTAIQYLRLADALGIARVPVLVPPRAPNDESLRGLLGAGWAQQKFAVLHPAPMYRYKSWTQTGWRELIQWLAARQVRVVLSGGPAPAEREYVDAIARDWPAPTVINLAGRLRFSELTLLIERACVFVGPDTSVTHLAAACGVPTVALFGPSHPVAWGPWPQGYAGAADSPWQMRAPLQHQGNVWIVQGITDCVPCLQEGCERHLNSRADCLDFMPASRVIAVVTQALA